MTEIYDPVEPEKDYIVQVRVKNGPMLRAMRRKGWTAAELSRQSGISQVTVGHFLNLKRRPIRRDGEWLPAVLAIARVFGCLPDDLFPPQHLEAALKHNSGEFEVSYDELTHLLAPPATPEALVLRTDVLNRLHQSLATLSPRQERILRLRFGLDGGAEMTAEEVGQKFGITQGRISQIEATAIRRLKHPMRRLLQREDIVDLAAEDPA